MRDILTDERKWIRGILELGDRRCLLGALRDTNEVGVESRVAEVILTLFPERHDPVCQAGCLECHPETTFEECPARLQGRRCLTPVPRAL